MAKGLLPANMSAAATNKAKIMNDDLKKPAAGRADSVEAQEKYLVTKKKAIVQKLGMLAQKKCLITAQFSDGKNPLLTLILDVLKDKNLVILDYGPSESTNKKILGAKNIKFASQYEGVKTSFSTKKIVKAKYQGQPVFALPIPDAVLWLQRREFYRVKVPRGEPVRCQISLDDDNTADYSVLDIGVGGIGILDQQFSFGKRKGDVGSQLKDCNLVLPEAGEHEVTLEVRYHVPIDKHNRSEGQRVGFAFRELTYAAEAKIQQYMHTIELQKRRVAND